MDWFFKIRLIGGWLPPTMMVITIVGIALVVLLKSKKGWLKPLLLQLGIGILGFLAGAFVVWLISDVFRVFGVSLGWAVMTTIAIGVGVITALVAAAVQSKGLRRVLALIMAFISLLTCMLQVDGIYGEYTTMGSLFGHSQFSKLDTSAERKAVMSVKQWEDLADKGKLPSMPDRGEVHAVRIPATISDFRARGANVYLPPAALSEKPPALPVMIVLAGQPGNSDRFFTAGRLGQMLNAYAKQHHGLAPIAVSPDQNGAISRNSLCADTDVYGNAETYITKDVSAWVKANLPVSTKAKDWLIGGFSQGATCSTQLGPAHPDLYGHVFSAGGEIEPVDGSRKATVKKFFDSDEHAYESHVPITIIKRHSPSTQTWFSVAGEWDSKSQKNQLKIATAAKQAGMRTTTVIAHESGHDWHTVQAAMEAQVDMFGTETGMGSTGRDIADYPKLTLVDSATTIRTD